MKLTIDDKNLLKSYFRNDYHIHEVLNYIDSLIGFIEIKDKNLRFIIYYTRDDMSDIPLSFIRELIRDRYRGLITHKEIILHLILSPALKRFEDGDLTGKNVNSGFTFVNRNDIYIFRKEEFPKVILHELIHHESHIHQDKYKKINDIELKKVFNINLTSNIILNEAIVELWATLMHLIFVSKKYKIDLIKLFTIELNYSLFKVYQLFTKQSKMPHTIWNDNSNIYAYIIFKTIFMFNLKELRKIYDYPNLYDDTLLTQFLCKYKQLPVVTSNPNYIIHGKLIERDELSLCFMLFSDL